MRLSGHAKPQGSLRAASGRMCLVHTRRGFELILSIVENTYSSVRNKGYTLGT